MSTSESPPPSDLKAPVCALPSASGLNAPQGPPVIAGDGQSKTYRIRDSSFVVDIRYDVIKAIGAGAYGFVCSALDTGCQPGRFVAIKKIPKVLDDLGDAKRILRELRILRLLGEHPNIINLRHVTAGCTPEGLLKEVYVVTDLLDTDLGQLLRSSQRLGMAHHAFITSQLLAALAYVHSAGVIHRDIKPQNILINDRCELRICDFGLSRARILWGTAPAGSRRARSPAGCAATPCASYAADDLTDYVITRWYRPPEVLLGVGYNAAADVWSAACVLVEVMTRRPLFPGSDYLDQLRRICELIDLPPHTTLVDPVAAMLIPGRHDAAIRCVDALRRRSSAAHAAAASESESPPSVHSTQPQDDVEAFDDAAFHEEQLRKLLVFVHAPVALHTPGSRIYDCCDLIARALRFHPLQRQSAATLVRHPYAAPSADRSGAVKSPGPIQFDAGAAIERLDALYGADGHSKCWAFQSQRLSRGDLASAFLLEATLPAA